MHQLLEQTLEYPGEYLGTNVKKRKMKRKLMKIKIFIWKKYFSSIINKNNIITAIINVMLLDVYAYVKYYHI